MVREFNETTDIVDTARQSGEIALSVNAESHLQNEVTIDEARKLLDETGYGDMANIPLMIALTAGNATESTYKVDHKELFDIFVGGRERIKENVQKSYDEIVGMTNMADVVNVQGVKLLSEYKKKLVGMLDAFVEPPAYAGLFSAVSLFVKYLQIAYTLMGRQH